MMRRSILSRVDRPFDNVTFELKPEDSAEKGCPII